LNVRDILGYDTLLLSKDSMEHIETWLGTDNTSDVQEAEMPEDVSSNDVPQDDDSQGDVAQGEGA